MTDQLRALPYSDETERALLASVMIYPEEAWPHLSSLVPEVFHRQPHRELYAHMRAMAAAGQPLDDIGLLSDRILATQGHLDVAYLVGVMAGEMTAAYAEHYAKQLQDLYQRRRFIAEAGRLMRDAYETGMAARTSEELADDASRLSLIFETRLSQGTLTHADAVDQAMADVDAPNVNALKTGLIDLDAQILGFEPGALYVLGAKPAMGKSAVGYNFALASAKRGVPVAVASLEMPAKQLALRMLCSAADVDLSRVRQRTISSSERQRLSEAAASNRDLPIKYLTSADQTGQGIARDARKLRAAGQLELLVIDYLQLIETGKEGGRENRQQEISTLSRSLKKLAMELQIPIVVLSQLSRAVEARPNKRPVLSDLRESGAVEQDADVVMFLYRDEYYNPQTDQRGLAELIVAKQRNGPVGTVKLSYNAEFVRFADLYKMERGLNDAH